MYGFVTLAKVFKSVDNNFVALWKGDSSSTITQLPEDIGLYPVEVPELDETQHMDIMVTRQWLRVLSWQIQHRHYQGPNKTISQGFSENPCCRKDHLHSHYPFTVAKGMLAIVLGAKQELLESHGIGIVSVLSSNWQFSTTWEPPTKWPQPSHIRAQAC